MKKIRKIKISNIGCQIFFVIDIISLNTSKQNEISKERATSSPLQNQKKQNVSQNP